MASAVLGQASLVAHARAGRAAAPVRACLRTKSGAAPKHLMRLCAPIALKPRLKTAPRTRVGFGDTAVLPQRRHPATFTLPQSAARRCAKPEMTLHTLLALDKCGYQY
eukprot:1188578-Prorocentrum_minimum.AAC.6